MQHTYKSPDNKPSFPFASQHWQVCVHVQTYCTGPSALPANEQSDKTSWKGLRRFICKKKTKLKKKTDCFSLIIYPSISISIRDCLWFWFFPMALGLAKYERRGRRICSYRTVLSTCVQVHLQTYSVELHARANKDVVHFCGLGRKKRLLLC